LRTRECGTAVDADDVFEWATSSAGGSVHSIPFTDGRESLWPMFDGSQACGLYLLNGLKKLCTKRTKNAQAAHELMTKNVVDQRRAHNAPTEPAGTIKGRVCQQ
jgi:hypothetical protein